MKAMRESNCALAIREVNMAAKPTKAAEKRIQLRETLWPGASDGDGIWDRKQNDGFITVPRLLALIMALIKRLAAKGDPIIGVLRFVDPSI